MKLSWKLPIILLVVLALAAGPIRIAWRYIATQQLMAELRESMRSRDYLAAHQLATRLLYYQADSEQALRAAGESLWRMGRGEDAFRYYRQLVQSDVELQPTDHLAMGEILMLRNHPSAAEVHFRDALRKDHELHAARMDLVYLLSIECRRYEALAERQRLLCANLWTVDGLLYLAKPEDLMQSPRLDEFLKEHPKDPYLLLAKARVAGLQQKRQEQARWLDEALTVDPELVEAHADRGLLLLRRGATDQELDDWALRLPENADRHPEIWVVRGELAKRRGDQLGAVRCFAEAVSRDSNHRTATHQLSLALARLGEDALAFELSQRVELLGQLEFAASQLQGPSPPMGVSLQVAQSLEALGRTREAAAWYRIISDRNPRHDEAAKKAVELNSQLSLETPILLHESNLLLRLDLQRYRLPTFGSRPADASFESHAQGRGIRFQDVADSTGLEFSFIGAHQPTNRVPRTYEMYGSGVGVIDFDLDGWPDVYCAQGASLEEGELPGVFRDQFFRNSGTGHFDKVTGSCKLGDTRFGQGVAVGDFDNDGFPDLLVANIGENRLCQNNGDGTFTDVTDQAGISGGRWTSSVALADLNGDALPDLFEVNYLGGDEVFRVQCSADDNRVGACSPRRFPDESDRFWLNEGDGTFSDQTRRAGIGAPGGKGLGIVVGDFAAAGELSVFVANDTTANHFYVNQSPPGEAPQFDERAILAGLAYDFSGDAQAGMGVAAGDFDADGHLDLFVTNFSNESNTLYRRQAAGFFTDVTREVGLFEPSLPMLGFGTQFLDADLDGDNDLVVCNGSVGDDGPGRTEFQMRPQFFENRNGKYSELDLGAVGEFWERKALGRALACLDFDRDGRQDFIVSHLDVPLVLMHNETTQPGHFLAIQLRAVMSARDAIGAVVNVSMPDGTSRTSQLTAGDGYMCSNQRQIVLGLDHGTTVAQLRVRWPSGGVSQFTGVAADQHFLVVEGRDQLYHVPR